MRHSPSKGDNRVMSRELRKSRFSNQPPEPERVGVENVIPSDGVSPGPAGGRRIAVVVYHGMGQQVRFETIGSVARLIGLAAEAQSNTAVSETATRFVEVSGVKTARAELTITCKRDQGEQRQEVHVYEAYWAPLTEGVVRLRDVVMFLFRAAWNGLRGLKWPPTFRRFIFNGICTFPVGLLTGVWLGITAALVALVILFALGVTWGVAGFVLARGDDVAFWRDVFQDWTKDVPFFLIPLAITSLILWWSSARLRRKCIDTLHEKSAGDALKKKIRNRDVAHGAGWKGWLIWGLLGVTALGLLVTDLAGLLHLLSRAGRLPEMWSVRIAWPEGLQVHPGFQLPTWGLALILALVVRWFIVQFVGDVAGYVSAPWLDRFNKLRDDIQGACCGVTRAVYTCQDYDRVVIVGHSLGSVIAYDVLNLLVNEDLLGKTPGVIRRTSALLTFGSPLDKTAFVFRTHTRPKQYVREALAASVQPLVVSYAYRPPLWLNIWSRCDVISGSLDYYDAQSSDRLQTRRVQNEVDRQADLPLIAHIQYWNNPLLSISLLRAVEQVAPGETISVDKPAEESPVLAV
jgi:hypothetical protein